MVKNFSLLGLVIYFILGVAPQIAHAQNEKDFSINGLPAVYIDMPASAVITKDAKLKVSMRIENAYGSNFSKKDLYNGLVEISGRGNTTWGMPKKPYNIDLITEDGEDNPASLLGMPEDTEWALIANYADKSLLRIPVAYYLGNAIGMEYSPRMRYVEVFLNNQYLGLYCLCEKIKKSDDRVNVKKLTEKDSDQVEPTVSGGYIVEVTPKGRIEPDEKYVTSVTNINYVFKYPKKKKITDPQIAWFRQYINKVENTLYGSNFRDPDKGYRQYLDVKSFVDWYLINDYCKNPDATFFASVYLFKDRNGKLKMGPLWDFDIAFGNIDFNPATNEENGFWVKLGAWFNRLTQDPYFQQKVSDRYDQLKPMFDSLPQVINKAAEYLQNTGGIDRNFEKWPILGKYVWPNVAPYPSTYEGEVQRLTDWIMERTDWMNIYLPVNKADQCMRLKNTKPHISITDIDEFKKGDSCRIKTTNGYSLYFWNGKQQATNILQINEGGKYWVKVQDHDGCQSLVSDTLYFAAKAEIAIDSSFHYVYDGMPKLLQATTIPQGIPVKYTFNGDTTSPVVPGEYSVVATINSPFYKEMSTTSVLHIYKKNQQITFPEIPQVAFINQNLLLGAVATSGLPVDFIISGKGSIIEGKLYPKEIGEISIQAFQPGNQFYEPSDTILRKIWAEYPNDFNKNISVFPSPFKNKVTMIYPYVEQTKLTIYTLLGRCLREYTLTGSKKDLELNFLTKGTYLLHFSSSKGTGYFKIVKM